jgi:alpha-L-fucosidase
MYDNEPEVYERSLDVLKRRAPRLWRQAVEKATDQFREHEPEKLTNSVAVEILAYQWAINLRGPNWPAWLVGPLLEVARKIGTHTGTG